MTTTLAVRERPILFSGEMVRAILAGRKTQTRRVAMVRECGVSVPAVLFEDGAKLRGTLAEGRSPYGAPGERLWVKETIRFVGATAIGDVSEYAADGAFTKADGWPWKRPVLPSIHCPRGLSRVTLEVTAVRVERLQAIREREEANGDVSDALAEGIVCEPDDVGPRFGLAGRMSNRTAWAAYARLWTSINGHRPGCEWGANPWVWVVDFRRVPADA